MKSRKSENTNYKKKLTKPHRDKIDFLPKIKTKGNRLKLRGEEKVNANLRPWQILETSCCGNFGGTSGRAVLTNRRTCARLSFLSPCQALRAWSQIENNGDIVGKSPMPLPASLQYRKSTTFSVVISSTEYAGSPLPLTTFPMDLNISPTYTFTANRGMTANTPNGYGRKRVHVILDSYEAKGEPSSPSKVSLLFHNQLFPLRCCSPREYTLRNSSMNLSESTSAAEM